MGRTKQFGMHKYSMLGRYIHRYGSLVRLRIDIRF